MGFQVCYVKCIILGKFLLRPDTNGTPVSRLGEAEASLRRSYVAGMTGWGKAFSSWQKWMSAECAECCKCRKCFLAGFDVEHGGPVMIQEFLNLCIDVVTKDNGNGKDTE